LDGLPIWKLGAPQLLAMLKDPKSTEFQKAIAMKKLAFVGTKEAVQPMAAYLSDPHLCSYARMGLEGNPDPSADDALRAALPKVSGLLKVGVITSIGYRKDAKALDALIALISDRDVQVAGAAATAVALIGGVQAGKALQAAVGNAAAPVFPVAARAALVYADNLAGANRARAIEMFTVLSATTMPEPVRLSALRFLNAAGPAAPGARRWVPPTGAAAEADQSGFLGRGRGGGGGQGRGQAPPQGQDQGGGRGRGGPPSP
jgi:HEAT repeat protein